MAASDPVIDPKWGQPSALHDPQVLAHFQARPTDVLITTAPKAGTTWMQQILHQLRTGGDASFASIFEVVPWLEMPRKGVGWRDALAAYERIPSPRVFKTHCTYAQTPGTDTAKIILTVRDPRDCCVSFFHHVNGFDREALPDAPIGRFEDMQACVDRFLAFGAWYRNVASWWPHRGEPNVLMLRYQDLIADLPGAVDRILSFLGWELSPEGRARALEHASFAWMKAHSDKFTKTSADAPAAFVKDAFIRKGKVGGHTEELTPAQGEALLARARVDLAPECLAYLGIA